MTIEVKQMTAEMTVMAKTSLIAILISLFANCFIEAKAVGNERIADGNLLNDFAEIYAYEKAAESKSNVINVVEDESWPSNKSLNTLGQVAGIAVTADGEKVFAFHRGNVVWDKSSFDMFNNYQHKTNGLIDQNTVLILNSSNGDIISSWGKNMFYMPHGISIDPEGNVWLTDVALHQVFRFKKDSWDEPDLVIGEAFVPGNGPRHFCKPTDIAISSSGIVYISDGYCNQRVVIMDAKGRFIREIATRDNLWVPHSLTLLENEDLICVADREHARVMCYTAGLSSDKTGDLVFQIPFSGPIYAIDRFDHILFGVTGPSDHRKPMGEAIALATEQLLGRWSPKSTFFMPHDLTVSQKTKAIYVTEISKEAPKKIYKFNF